MATTKAQRAASARYDRENTKQVSVKLNTRTDAEMLAHLAAQPNVQGYIKRLVREDMYRIAEDGMMEDQLAVMMADGTAKVSRSSVGGRRQGIRGVKERGILRKVLFREKAPEYHSGAINKEKHLQGRCCDQWAQKCLGSRDMLNHASGTSERRNFSPTRTE